jgi:integrase
MSCRVSFQVAEARETAHEQHQTVGSQPTDGVLQFASATPSAMSTGRRTVPQRRFQRGCLVKRGEKWVGLFRQDVRQSDGMIKRMQRGITLGDIAQMSHRAALAAFQPYLDGVNAFVPATPKVGRTVDEVIKEWRKHIAGSLKPSTMRAAESHIRHHILPRLGQKRLTELGTKTLQSFATDLSVGERTRKTIENILLTLSSVLRTARSWGYSAPEVSMSDLALPRVAISKESPFLSADQMQQVIEAADEPFATLLTVLSMTGLRIGEALGLLVSDLDFRKRVIQIRRSVYMGILQTTKSRASIADLPMPAALESRLKDFLVSKWRQNETGLLFCNRNDKPYSANKLREKKLHPILDTLKIPRCGFHAIRHGVASELIDSGAPLTVVQAQMRHSDARITLGRYGHVVGDSQRNAVAALAQKIAQPELLIPIVDINNSTTVPVN